MIKYFSFKKIHGRDDNRSIFLRTKKNAFDKNGKEEYISKNGSIIIYGIEASGKSHKLSTIIKNVGKIWRKEEAIIFKATDSLSEILLKNLDNKDDVKKLITLEDEENEEDIIDYSKQYIKFEALKQKAKNSVLVIDDLDKLTGKKLELTKDLLRNCKRFVVTAKSETSINRTVQNIIKKRKMNVTEVQLSSNASVDATNILLAVFILSLFVCGLPEVAMLVMAGRLASKGTK